MNHARFVISLDFELFWGVGDTQTIGRYGRNVRGEWQAVPRMLALFRYHHVNVTWATVGAIMCRDYGEWRALRPPSRRDARADAEDDRVRQHPELFFARPLVERILDTDGQELATHTYSHFYCNAAGATPAQFVADLARARDLAAGLGAGFQTVVFPRNQVSPAFLAVLPEAGIRVYRGNAQHWLYRRGDAVPGGMAGRIVRYADAFLPLSGSGCRHEQVDGDLVNVPASLFLYPWSAFSEPVVALRLRRIKQGMTMAARTGALFHLWWHPHNFGVDLGYNMAMLGEILRHYRYLADRFGMESQCMGAFAGTAGSRPAPAQPLPAADLCPWGTP
nr:polysaccharide deacetylase family protein [Massilia sp. JS1662]